MEKVGTHRNSANSLPFVLAALAMLVKMLLPAGYMFSSQSALAGLTPITLCTGVGPALAFIDKTGAIKELSDISSPRGKAPSDEKAPTKHGGDHCTPSANSVLLSPLLLRQSFTFFFSTTAVHDRDLHLVAPGQGLAAPPPPKTGPPYQASDISAA